MECPGEYLKREREHRGVSLADISSTIKVQESLLRLLESDKYDSMPHPTFVKGYIKAYCKFLGIDENDAVLRFELYLQELAGFENKPKGEFDSGVASKSKGLHADRKIILGALVIIVLFLIVFIYFFTREPAEEQIASRKPPSESVIKARADAEKKAEEKAVAGKAEEKAVVKKTPVKKKAATKPVKAQAKVEPTKPAALTKPVEVKALEVAAKPKAVESPGDSGWLSKMLNSGDGAVKNAAVAPLASSSGFGHTLMIKATEMTWLSVTIDSKEPKELILKAGEKAEWKADKGFFLFLGNAAGAEVVFDGTNLGTLGKKGETLKLNLPEL